jgi:hypothetical protein
VTLSAGIRGGDWSGASIANTAGQASTHEEVFLGPGAGCDPREARAEAVEGYEERWDAKFRRVPLDQAGKQKRRDI